MISTLTKIDQFYLILYIHKTIFASFQAVAKFAVTDYFFNASTLTPIKIQTNTLCTYLQNNKVGIIAVLQIF